MQHYPKVVTSVWYHKDAPCCLAIWLIQLLKAEFQPGHYRDDNLVPKETPWVRNWQERYPLLSTLHTALKKWRFLYRSYRQSLIRTRRSEGERNKKPEATVRFQRWWVSWNDARQRSGFERKQKTTNRSEHYDRGAPGRWKNYRSIFILFFPR